MNLGEILGISLLDSVGRSNGAVFLFLNLSVYSNDMNLHGHMNDLNDCLVL